MCYTPCGTPGTGMGAPSCIDSLLFIFAMERSERKKLKFHANAKEIPLNGSTDSYKALTKIRTCRTTKDNGVHKRSSRSHAIYVVTCGSYVYTIVDLAGFESNVNAESQYINVSLYCLRECVLALGKKNMYVNFRQSRLTYCLQDLLSQSISCICTVSLDDEEATRNTIAYGISMKEIKRHLKTTLKKTTIKNYYNHTKRVTQLEENVIKAYNEKLNDKDEGRRRKKKNTSKKS